MLINHNDGSGDGIMGINREDKSLNKIQMLVIT